MNINATAALPSANFTPSSPTTSISLDGLQEIATKRISAMDYLRRVHEGRTHWFNTILLSKEELERIYDDPKNARRAVGFLVLGLSIANLVELQTSNTDLLKNFLVLLNEHEDFTNDNKPKMRNFFRAGARMTRRDSEAGSVDEQIYTHLQTMNIPFQPDFFQVFSTLCDVLIEVYCKILNTSPPDTSTLQFDLFQKFDARIRKLLTGVIKDVDVLARNLIHSELLIVERMGCPVVM
ncbi:hypothetical protein NEOLI_002442 [Neolecta irregularis DAH-3]|uniref:Uncharacterized protein n=1 Tax=Neolecta irregularis (strain DAH-3) TaxID=1198029 RepID=A0A1U7LUR3_NEOID|nr:hypothetical protein NEOLI_002442 [Neolecta irregularis DAH-3]|eukprot:OLL26416.1 hypothetical protein NEOLI_002442 [Neolecta irregularis DAH-3]